MNAFTFAVPDGFTDATNYTFQADESPEELSVTAEPMDWRNADAQATVSALTQMRSQAEHAFGDRVSFADIHSVAVGGRAGHAVTMTAREEHPILYRIASVTSPRDLLVVIKYASLHADPHSQGTFDHCLASVRFDEAFQPPAPGYHRAHPIAISLDVPRHLHSPAVMSFLSDGELFRIRVDVGTGPSDLRTFIADDVACGARIEHLEIQPYERGDLVGEQSSRVSHLHGQQYSVRHAVVAAIGHDPRRWLSIECQGPVEPSGMDVGHVLARILATLRPSAPN